MSRSVQNYNNTYAFGALRDLSHYVLNSHVIAERDWCGKCWFGAGRVPKDMYGAARLRWNREKRTT